ncbi:MAG: ORF6C domain-containing protein [Chloroflexota bacterium]|nr:ORF6C domain-containing protein [Chloroflexota bacterium]
MSDDRFLSLREERHIDFYGDLVTAVLLEEQGQQQIYIPIRPIATYLGLDWSAQSRRLHRTQVLAEVTRSVAMTATEAGGERELLCLPLDYLAGWLFGIDPTRVKPDLKEKVLRYQRECYHVLAQAFRTEALAVLTPATAHRDPRVTALAGQIDTVRAELTFLREHLSAILLAEDRIEDVAGRLEQATTLLERIVGEQAQQAAQVEDTADLAAGLAVAVAKIDERTTRLTPAHCRAVQDQVTYMVEESARQRKALSYSWIYGRLKQQFGVGSYKEIDDDYFERVMAYLRDALHQVTGHAAPEQQPLF